MAQGPARISDKITILVFKDNNAARTFQISLSSISRFGFILGTLLAITLSSTFIALKYYRIAAASNPIYVQDLEQEIIDLKANLKTIETKSESLSSPIIVSTPTPIATPMASNTVPPFSIFTHAFQPPIADPSTLRFSIQTPEISWQKSSLHVRFALQYRNKDQGSQEGKILVLARGPETLLTYPAGSLNPIGAENLIDLNKGETFSVSRYRAVDANFGQLHSKNALHEVEIFILNNQGNLLTYQKIPLIHPNHKSNEETVEE